MASSGASETETKVDLRGGKELTKVGILNIDLLVLAGSHITALIRAVSGCVTQGSQGYSKGAAPLKPA